MKKILAFILIFALVLICVCALVSCTDGEEDETHNIIIGGPEDDDEMPTVSGDETIDDSWELGGVPLG